LDIPNQYALIIKLIIFQRWQMIRGKSTDNKQNQFQWQVVVK
jgi:hypothetical protein